MTTQFYVRPDFAVLRDNRETIRYQAIVGSANLYIKALSDELLGLNAAVSSTDQLVANAITSAITALETDDLLDNLESLAALTAREEQAGAKNAIKIYSTLVNQLMELCTRHISTLRTQLHTGVFNVQSIAISNNRFRLAELADNSISLSKELSAEQSPLDTLIDDESLLNTAIGLFEKVSYIDRVKPLFEQLTAMIGNKPETPESAAIKAGLIIANKFLDEANELLKYKDLLEARQIIQKRIGERQARVTTLQAQLRDNTNRTRQLNDTQKVVPHQASYVSESSKIVDALSLFLATVKPRAGDNMVQTGYRMMEQCDLLRSYMNALQGRWLRG